MLHDKKIYASGAADEFFASQDRWCGNSLTASPIRRKICLESWINRDWKPKSACSCSSDWRCWRIADLFSKGTSLFHGTYELRLHAGNVGGLKPRAGVLLAGVQVGSVSTSNSPMTAKA